MGMHGDMLFADPLGVRAGSCRSQNPRASHKGDDPFGVHQSAQYADRAPYSGSALRGGNDGDILERHQKDDEEENWGPLGSFFWYVFAGGKQCCSMRDRTKPQDVEAAKKAAETGRPPKSRFPEPPKPGLLDHTFAARRESEGDPFNKLSGSRSGSTERPYASASRLAPPPVPSHQRRQGGEDSDSDSDADQLGSQSGRKGRAQPPQPPVFSGWAKPPSESGVSPQPKAGDAGSERPPPALGSGSGTGARPQEAVGTAGAVGTSSSPPGQNPKRWEWPPWCLNFKAPCIEVYVVDDETGVGKWVEAEPQSRVVDKAGRDAYLCVEYEWDGEYYVQDFGPQHVRRRGQQLTVFHMFEKAAGEDSGNAGKAQDTGGGISAFLGRD